MTVPERMRSLGLDPDEPNPWPGTLRLASGVAFVPVYEFGKDEHVGYTTVWDYTIGGKLPDGVFGCDARDDRETFSSLGDATDPVTIIERILIADGCDVDSESFARARREMNGKWSIKE